MAIRKIRVEGDPILRKKTRLVETIDERIHQLLDDMVETMDVEDGVGLAAPQVGVLKRLFVIRIDDELIEMINPEIVDQEGSRIEIEGCLSVPGKSGLVERPQWVKIKGLDRHGKEVVHEGRGLLAKAFCHETDHLDGVLYIDKTVEEEA